VYDLLLKWRDAPCSVPKFTVVPEEKRFVADLFHNTRGQRDWLIEGHRQFEFEDEQGC